MSIIYELAPILVTGLAGLASGFAGNFLKEYLDRKRSVLNSLRYEIEGKGEVDVPAAKDWSSLKERLAALQRISPTLAVLDGWALVCSAISERGSEQLGTRFDPDQDPMKTLTQLPNVSEDLIAQVRHIREIRNMVAHAKLKPDHPEVVTTADRVLPVLERLGLRFPLKN
jgi:hypothetical protein